MKYLIFLLLIIFSLGLQAKLIETPAAFTVDYTSNIDAQNLYNGLSLPIDFGTLITGKNHSYKSFQDKDKNFLIYCTQNKKADYTCVFSINKEIKGDLVALENDNLQIHAMITDYDQSLALYNALNIPVIHHGSYLVKVLADENNMMGISCMTDSNTYAEYRCDIRIFKENL